MLKSFISVIITLALGAASVYFFYEFNFIVAVLLFVWFISRMFGYNLKRLAQGFVEITTHSNLEAKCNCSLELRIRIEEVLKHPHIDRLFNVLQKRNIIPPSTRKEDWAATMLENYKMKFGGNQLEEVKFNIKNNLLWKNSVIEFRDSLYHEFFIPYVYKDGKEEEESTGFLGTAKIEIGMTLRIFVVNGIIKLQVGEFDKAYASDTLNNHVYQTYDTITSFPLMYFSYRHKIPQNYLNLSAYATESWKDSNRRNKSKLVKNLTAVRSDVNSGHQTFHAASCLA